MKKTLVALSALALLSCAGISIARAQSASSPAAVVATRSAVAAARAFLETLSVAQRATVQFDFPAQALAGASKFKGGKDGRMDFIGEQYGQAVWSNYPVSDVPRPGLSMGSLSPVQRAAAMHLLQTVLSAKGYIKVQEIMGSDQALSEDGTNYASGVAYYTIGLFGRPDAASPWLLQFGGITWG